MTIYVVKFLNMSLPEIFVPEKITDVIKEAQYPQYEIAAGITGYTVTMVTKIIHPANGARQAHFEGTFIEKRGEKEFETHRKHHWDLQKGFVQIVIERGDNPDYQLFLAVLKND